MESRLKGRVTFNTNTFISNTGIYALLPGHSPATPATASPHHVSQGQGLIFHVSGCSPRLLHGIDRFHKLIVILIEPMRAANKNKVASVILFIDVIRLH